MILLGLVVGALLGLLAVPAVARLPRGIPERLAQPAWTARAGRPVVLCTVGAVLGALLGAAAPDDRTLALGLVLLAVLLPMNMMALGQGGASLVQWCQLLRVPALGGVAGP